MFLASILTSIIGEQAAVVYSFKEKRVIDNKLIKAVYTQNGLERMSVARGKPVVTVQITNPSNGAEVNGSIEIQIYTNSKPNIAIDGSTVGKGDSYLWDTTQYSDGSHTIRASAKGIIDQITVTVNNGGQPTNNPPVASFTYTTANLVVSFTDTSTDLDDDINSWNWNFGDYSTSSEKDPTHIYASAGTYTVSLTVTDDDENTDMVSQPITVLSGSGDVDKYALVIGISDYEGGSSDLKYCDDDAIDWKNFLIGEGYTVNMLIDSQATADNIIAAVNDLINIEDGDDYVVFVYSGHGTKITGLGSCIVTHDFYGISHEYFENLFDDAESQHIFFSFDACVIGDFQGLITNNRVGAFASNDRYSYDGRPSMKNGVFTYYQMEGWDIYDNFEEDSVYAVQQMEDWAPGYIIVDPFYVDQFPGLMLP